ncbi:ricin-type beta-trefoil lectin domain protein [Streptomyces sp. NPDC000410]|uniref:ricin-type beta-trefoil lectin domain protein n=1 Tax=Streptomyces sp. NPDC000410 TaxID=3154254 RepID=UPI00332011A8
MRITGKHRLARKRRRSILATCGVVGITAAALFTPSAFGSDDEKPDTTRPASTAAQDIDHAQDFGASAVDGTTFENGVMTLRAAPAARAAAAASAPPSGEGWKSGGATKLLPTGYTVKFYDQKSVDWLARYVKASAADLQRVTNLPVTVDTRPVGWDYRRPKGEVVIGLLKHPCVPTTDGTPWKIVRDGSGSKNLSCAFYASSVADTVTSGHGYIDSAFFTADGKPSPSWGETFLRNHISHEVGHTMGLAHADRSATRGDCVKGSDSGQKPVMCTNGMTSGYQDKRAGSYVQQFDMQGLRHLAKGAGAALPPQGRVTGIGGKCLDVKGGKAVNGTQIQLYTCNGGVAQSWILGKDGTLRALGKCLDNARNASTNGNKISLFDCHGQAAQRWSVNAKGQIVHVASGKVLDVTGGSTANSTKIQLYTANTGKGQVWVTPK